MQSSNISLSLTNQVRNESAEDFLLLLEEWEKLCYYFSLIKSNDIAQEYADLFGTKNVADDGSGDDDDSDEDDGKGEVVFEVEKILGLYYGNPKKIKKKKKHELYLKVFEFQTKS